MKPVLFTFDNLPLVGTFPISSFGLALLFAFLAGAFIVWRIGRLYDIDAETTIDIILVCMLGALIGGRIYFLLFNLGAFDSVAKIFLLSKFPGLSFWGAIFGGLLSLYYFSKKIKFNFLQIADILTPAVFLALSITSFGCLLGSCQYGLPSFFGISQAGVMGRRFPLQVIESALYIWLFFRFYRTVLKFHSHGQIASKGLIVLGIAKFIFEYFRGDSQSLIPFIRLGNIWALLLIISGGTIYYKFVANTHKGSPFDHPVKRSPLTDFRYILKILGNKNKRQYIVLKIKKSCYNTLVDLRLSLNRTKKNLFRVLNVKSNPTKF